MHFAWTFSSQPPQKHPLIYCSTYFQAHSHPITSSSFRPQHYFIGWVFFSLESHPTGELCVIFVRNYVLACMFCIVWCQQISIWSKQIESLIYFIKRVWFLKNLMIREGAGNTENLDFKLRDHRDPFHRNKRTGTHTEGLNIFSYAKILCAIYGHNLHLILIW